MKVPNNISEIKQHLLTTLVLFLFVSSSSYAEIFKWVDENGRTHYSDKKLDTGKSTVESLEVKPSLNLMPAVSSSEPGLKERELESQKRTAQSQVEPKKEAQLVSKKREEKKREDVDPRCTLANKIIRGEARLTNGAPTGEHEIAVAKRDIGKFCK